MNILIPDTWLRDFLETKAKPLEIQKYLSLCGPSVERIETSEGELVYDIEVTTNRVDCMSMQGIAREASVILPEFEILAKLKLKISPQVKSNQPLGIRIINDPRLCHRILAIKLSNVKISPSPQWLQKRLIQVGQRPLNNLIDITNYVMWEIGHPTHVFDYDRITNQQIIVREAKRGEIVITLDEKKHQLKGGEVVFDDGTGQIIDLPGIMGTANTVVNDKTKNILVWIESIDAVKIRQASMGLAIRSQAAVLNEKGVDPELEMPAILRCVELYQELAGGQIASELVDIYPGKPEIKSTKLSQNLINTYLGVEVKSERVRRILENLGCSVKLTTENRQLTTYIITPPSWRANDLQIPEDYIEEIARIYGYHNLPSTLMATPIPDNPPDENFDLEQKIKTWLADWQFQEVYSYSMVSEVLAKQSGYRLNQHMEISNPLNEEWVYMRRSLMPSLLEIINNHPQREIINLFEMANVYHPRKGNLPHEELHLTLTTTQDFKFLKGIIDNLMSRLFTKYEVKPFKSKPNTTPRESKPTLGVTGGLSFAVDEKPTNTVMFNNNQDGEIWIKDKIVGYLGKINNGSEKDLWAADFMLSDLLKLVHGYPKYQPISQYPPIIEDLTFTFPLKTFIQPVIDEIYNVDKLIAQVKLIDSYEDARTFRIHYQSGKKSLSDAEVEPIRRKIVQVLEKKFNAKLKGELYII